MSKVLTVVVPAYNVEAYLERGLSSFLDERLLGRLEVLIIDDGSTDGTRAIAQKYASIAPQTFRVVTKENGGHGSAINRGIELATGAYFRIVDGDDWVHTDGLAEELDILEHLDADLVVDKKREVDMLTGENQLFELAGSPELWLSTPCVSTPCASTPYAPVLGSQIPTSDQQQSTPCVSTPCTPIPFSCVCQDHAIAAQLMIHTLTVRTELLRRAGVDVLEHTFYEDFEYVVKASAPASTIAFLDIEVYQYLVGNATQSVSHQNYVRRWDDHTRVVRELLRYAAEARAGHLHLSAEARAYVEYKLHLVIDTHYNIALLFDADRTRGRARAREFRAELRATDRAQWRLGERRYWSALALNVLGMGRLPERVRDLLQKERRRFHA